MEEVAAEVLEVAVPARDYGARVTDLGATILVQQTVKSGPAQNDRYVIDRPGDKRERFVAADNDAAIAQAVRDALAGQLGN